jgi:hypothetical protein
MCSLPQYLQTKRSMSGVTSSFPPQFGQFRVMKLEELAEGLAAPRSFKGEPHLKQNLAGGSFADPQLVQ